MRHDKFKVDEWMTKKLKIHIRELKVKKKRTNVFDGKETAMFNTKTTSTV